MQTMLNYTDYKMSYIKGNKISTVVALLEGSANLMYK